MGGACSAPRTFVEAELCAIWRAVLGVEDVGTRDSFFELGGDSILALEMTARAREAGIQVVLRDLFERPTVEYVASMVNYRQFAARPPQRSPLAAISLGGQDAAAGAFVLLPSLYDLHAVRELGAHERSAPLHALFPAWSPSIPYVTLSRIAALAVSGMRTLQPRGPYRIVGYCSAGLAAYEAAGRLVAGGETVSLLLLADTVHPRSQREPARLADALPVDPLSRLQMAELIGKLAHLDRLRRSRGWADSRRALMRELWGVVRSHIGELLRFVVEVGPEHWDEALCEAAARSFMGWLNYVVASEAYAPPLYPGAVDLVFSHQPGCDDSDATGEALIAPWARLHGSACRLHWARVTHSTLLDSDVVCDLVWRSRRPERAVSPS